MNKTIAFIATLTLTACAGRTGNPITISQPDDKGRACATIAKEIEQIRPEIARLEPEAKKIAESNQEIKSSFMSYILLIPFIPYDTHQGEQAELDAYKARLNYLELLSTEKSCIKS